MTAPLALDAAGGASLDGDWELFPGDHDLDDLDRLVPAPIRVPGLWEAQGHLDLDGVAWYRRRFRLDDAAGHWTLRFGAVMDMARVYLNGRLLGGHELAFTPFELDPARALRAGENTLAVQVTDPPAGDPEHRRLPHGKQGWANGVFPSPPSLYLTYGGIWQPVRLRRHGPVAVRDVFVDGDPDELTVTVELEEVAGAAATARITLRTLGLERQATVALAAGGRAVVRLPLGATTAERWSPERPALHRALVEVAIGRRRSDAGTVRFGLRTVRVDGERLLVDGQPYRMRSALVQGFWPRGLYAEDGPAAIRAEVAAAKAMGLNTLRLHVKAFDPAYLDACDELGMFLHCDLPVAEPVAQDELQPGSVLARRCQAAARAQVRRDRNHPSVLLWSAMNELGLENDPQARASAGYEGFARALVAAVREADPTRPVIENDWVEPDPAQVFTSPLLTAHWYGRLHAEYLEQLDARAARWAGTGRPLLVTEFGDWGLPEPAAPAGAAPFWHQGRTLAADLAATPWPGDLASFARGTQRYQGLADRLQAEVLRRHDHIGGWCVTELTDVPHELNGLLDLERRPKAAAVEELARACQPVLPMLAVTSLTWTAGGRLRAPLHVANDGPELNRVRVEARLGGAAATVAVGRLPGHRAVALGEVELPVAAAPGGHELLLTLTASGRPVAANRYPVRVVAGAEVPLAVELAGGGPTAAALAAVGARLAGGAPIHRGTPRPGGGGPLVVAEGGLDAAAAARLRGWLAAGGTALVLAQAADAAHRYPLPAAIAPVGTGWGSSVFHFTTDHDGLPSLPRRTVLATEDLTVKPAGVLARLGGGWPATTIVGAYKPPPDPLQGTVVGACPVGSGRLLACQFRLAGRAAGGDPTALALLADLLRLAARPAAVPAAAPGATP